MGCNASKTSVTQPQKRTQMQNDLEALCKANTKSEVERLARQIFDVLDVDRTNSISKKELHTMMTQIVD